MFDLLVIIQVCLERILIKALSVTNVSLYTVVVENAIGP